MEPSDDEGCNDVHHPSSWDTFLTNHLEDILDLSDYLKDTVPYLFMNTKSTHLSELIMFLTGVTDSSFCIRLDTLVAKNKRLLLFVNEYEDELETTYRMVSRFLERFRCTLPAETWAKFCLIYAFNSS
jgi:hypothetical protein